MRRYGPGKKGKIQLEAKKLECLVTTEVVPYNAEVIIQEILKMKEAYQEYHISVPWFLMSGVGWLVFPLAQFKGYLNKFCPGTNEEGEPIAEMTVRAVEVTPTDAWTDIPSIHGEDK